jgi:nucleotide-binding universal stress UspA family protein
LSEVVVVGADGSDESRDALALGQQLARALDAELLAAYVHPFEELAGLLAGGPAREAEELIGELATHNLAAVREMTSGSAVAEVRPATASSAAAGLQALAIELGARLVVLGCSRRSGLGKVFPGGTGERLLSGSPVPVAVAPRGHAAGEGRFEVLGCGFDGSQTARQALAFAAKLARSAGARLRVLSAHRRYAFDEIPADTFGARSVSDELHAYLRESLDQAVDELCDGVRVEGEVLEGDPAQVLSDASERLDLLVLGSRGYGPLKSVLMGSVSAQVTRSASCPVLVVPNGAGETGASD